MNKIQKARQNRILETFEEIRQGIINLRDESDIGAEIIAKNELAQRVINSEIALRAVCREWREKILGFLGLKTTDLS